MQPSGLHRFVQIVFALTVAVTRGARAQRTGERPPRCYAMVYARDSANSPLPDHFRWSPSDSVARFWQASPTPNARELQKQTRGRAPARRLPGDSVVIPLWSFAASYGELRFAPADSPTSGIVQWMDEGHGPIERYTFTTRVVACPHLDPAS